MWGELKYHPGEVGLVWGQWWSVGYLSQTLQFKGLGLILRGKGKQLVKGRWAVEVMHSLALGQGFNLNFDPWGSSYSSKHIPDSIIQSSGSQSVVWGPWGNLRHFQGFVGSQLFSYYDEDVICPFAELVFEVMVQKQQRIKLLCLRMSPGGGAQP